MDGAGFWHGLRAWAASRRPDPFWIPALAHLALVALVFLVLGAAEGWGHVWSQAATKWDAGHYLALAEQGYPDASGDVPGLYAFPPLFPLLLRLLGSEPSRGLVATLLLGGAATGLVGLRFGVRAGLVFAAFPTWLWFSGTLYSEALFVALAAGALVAMDRGLHLPAGVLAALATLTRYAGGLGFAVLFLAVGWSLRRDRGRMARALVLTLGPLAVAGVAVMGWHLHATGDALAYLQAQEPWDAALEGPWAQADWLLHGWFTNMAPMNGIVAPLEWVLRNAAFGAVAAAGTVLLWTQGHRAEALFCVPGILVVLSTTGMPAVSVPRLLLISFPAFAALGLRMGRTAIAATVAVGAAGAAWIGSMHLRAFFA